MNDGGPDVYFKPQQLDRTLAQLLEQGALIHTGARVTIEYRRNGRERRAKGWVQFAEEDQVDKDSPDK